MPTLSITIEDFTPIISYSGSDWTAGLSQNDSSIDRYSDSSYMVTQVQNASVSFTFYGSGLQLYGAQRANHGSYQVTIDSRVYAPASGTANGAQDVFQVPLFQTAALASGLHKLTVVNQGNEFDLDFITWQIPVGGDQEPLLSFTFQDSDSSFQYTPASSWSTSPPSIGTFSGGSGHVTSTAGAFVEYTFTGKFVLCPVVVIFGPVGPQGAPYSVQLDNGAITNHTSSNEFYHPQTILFQAANLSSESHTVRLRSEAWNNSALTLGIDYAQVFTTPSLQPKTALAAGSILAIVFGLLLASSLIASGYLFFRHRRGRPPKSTEPVTPFQNVEYQSLGPPPHGFLQPVLRTSEQISNFGPQAANTEVRSVNSQSISFPQDRKYRPDLQPARWSSQAAEAASTSSPRILSSASLPSDTTEQGSGQLEIREVGKEGVRLSTGIAPGPAPPIYVPQE